MQRLAIPSLVLAAMVSGLWAAIPSKSKAETLANTQDSGNHKSQELRATRTGEGAVKSTSNSHLVAQLFYPPLTDHQAFRVLGQGQVTAPADTARIEFLFTRTNPSESPDLPTTQESVRLSVKSGSNKLTQAAPAPAPDPTTAPITKATMKAVVDALVAIGVPANDIDVNITPSSSSSSFPFPIPTSSEGGAKLHVKLNKPTRDRVEQVVTVASDAARKKSKIFVQSVNVQYAVKDCQALARTAYQSAVKDARNRAEAIASGMGAKIGNVPSVSELPFYDLLVPLCSTEAELPSFLPFANSSSPYDPSAPVEVQLRRDLFVTFPIK